MVSESARLCKQTRLLRISRDRQTDQSQFGLVPREELLYDRRQSYKPSVHEVCKGRVSVNY